MTELRFSDRVGVAIGGEVVQTRRLGGGDVAESFRMELADGRVVFAKTHLDPPPDFFQTEAAGLSWLREPGVVPVPEVLAVDDGLLVLEWIDEGRPLSTGEADFGLALADVHRAGAPCFGRADLRTTGSRRLPNEPGDTWAEFYAANRLIPLARLWADAGGLPDDTVVRLEVIAARLSEIGGPPEPPARLHGDLWAGNRLVDTAGRSWLIDPAAHGGHREFDLAMMYLFGGFDPECFAAYTETHPLATGWEARVPLHQLAPLAVHAVKFRGGYIAATARALDACDAI
jgi:fructosamine-3-kinase